MFKASGAGQKIQDDLKTVSRKIIGRRKTAKVKDDPSTPANEATRNHSASQLSYENIAGNFDDFVAILGTVPTYAPNEPYLTVAPASAMSRDATVMSRDATVMSQRAGLMSEPATAMSRGANVKSHDSSVIWHMANAISDDAGLMSQGGTAISHERNPMSHDRRPVSSSAGAMSHGAGVIYHDPGVMSHFEDAVHCRSISILPVLGMSGGGSRLAQRFNGLTTVKKEKAS